MSGKTPRGCRDGNVRIQSILLYVRTIGDLEKCNRKAKCSINRARPFNLGCYILPSKVASYAPFLSCLWTKLAEIQWTLQVTTLVEKSINISAKCVHKWLRKYVQVATFEGKIQQPKLKGRALSINQNINTMWQMNIFLYYL